VNTLEALAEKTRDWNRIDPQVKRNWVEALRSTNFRQGKGQMHNEYADTYCVMGVLQAVNGLLGLPWQIVDELIELNDVHHLTFSQLADVIDYAL
jgi:hypothetical protein